MMTRKHFKAMADGILSAKETTSEILGSSYCIRLAAEAIADACQSDNPRFDRARFMTACGFGKE